MASVRRKLERAEYYARNITRDIVPQFLFRRRLPGILGKADRYDADYLSQRVGYYNKLSGPQSVQPYSATIARIPIDGSMYYYDLKEHARYFPRHFRLNHIFGDTTVVPDLPSFMKARRIAGDNQNSILLNLDKFRHFDFPADPIAFRNKKPIAVWRGAGHNKKRVALLDRWLDHPLCDVGKTDEAPTGRAHRPFLSIADMMHFRYVISIEGNDVATNLKWIIASNCLCFMPAATCETWFMEGRLQAGVHYVQLQDDFENLEEKILYYENNLDEALGIIRNANSFAAQFRDKACERLVSLLVMYKYLVLTGQLGGDDRILKLTT